MAKMLRMLMLFMLVWPLAGCWDRIEIEERGFVVGTALDAAEDGQIKLTFQIVVPTQMKGSSGQKNEGGSPLSIYPQPRTAYSRLHGRCRMRSAALLILPITK